MARFDGLKPIVEGQSRSKKPEAVKLRVGKRGDPDYQQTSLYIRRDVYAKARHRLLDTGQDFSELVNQLVEEWVRKGK